MTKKKRNEWKWIEMTNKNGKQINGTKLSADLQRGRSLQKMQQNDKTHKTDYKVQKYKKIYKSSIFLY